MILKKKKFTKQKKKPKLVYSLRHIIYDKISISIKMALQWPENLWEYKNESS